MTRSTTNNIAFEWFFSYGYKKCNLDKRTIRNVTDKEFVNFAKCNATEEEKEFIDECVKTLAIEHIDV